jgi:hypothetical protein
VPGSSPSCAAIDLVRARFTGNEGDDTYSDLLPRWTGLVFIVLDWSFLGLGPVVHVALVIVAYLAAKWRMGLVQI